ncbi:type VI secretion system tube protein TssD [Rapidithrix thailandica]|uniref:Type VI secretion system tube protein TssD n=1 Tax=Rapidithrix thailandica TaxID=413964 RepID=A0AAW9SHK2_9BACT
MSLIARLYVEDKVVNILDFKFRFTRSVDEHGKPMGKPNGTIFDITFETTSDQSFFAWSVGMDMVKKVKIVVSPVTQDSKSRVFELYDVHCVFFKNNFNGVNGEPMTTQIKLSPAILYDGGYKILEHYWKETDLSVKTEPTPLTDPYDNLTAGAGNILPPVIEDPVAEVEDFVNEPNEPTGNLIIVIDGKDMDKAREALINAKHNVIWNYEFVDNIEEAIQAIMNYHGKFRAGAGIVNLVIRGHGNYSYFNLGYEYGVRAKNIHKYITKDPKLGSSNIRQIKALKKIARFMKEGGNLYFTSCHAGDCTEKPQNGSMGLALHELFKTDPQNPTFNIFLNEDLSSPAYPFTVTMTSSGGQEKKVKQYILNTKHTRKLVSQISKYRYSNIFMTSPQYFNYGWVKIDEAGKLIHMEGNPYINGDRGKPIEWDKSFKQTTKKDSDE